MEDFVDELLLQILENLDLRNLLNASQVCKKWYQVSRSQVLWKGHVLKRWPSQHWLYRKIPENDLNWVKIYQEFTQYGWYSPDQMRYFITCNTLEDEPISPLLRETMFLKMANISEKWLQATPLDHNGDMIARCFDKNMELFYNIRDLQWTFLDKRRGYMDKFYSRKIRHGNLEDYIRPYQVIPSCLMMYRFLCMFRSLAVPETGLTFYRIWRFRLKHMETGMIFEFCDWKAAASNTFSNGYPKISSFREDALELIHFLTHPHFIMQPFGLNPRLERIFQYAIHASAGGGLETASKRRKESNKRRKHSEPVSPRLKAAMMFGKQLYEKPTFPDLDEKLEQWRARRKSALLQRPISPRCTTSILDSNSKSFSPFSSSCSTLAASCSTFASETDSACDSTTDESQREFTQSDSESEFEFYENGYITNCEYFISNSDSFESVEDQHSLQASIADLWMINDKNFTEKIPVIYDVDDSAWYFQLERSCLSPNSSRALTPRDSFKTDAESIQNNKALSVLSSFAASMNSVFSDDEQPNSLNPAIDVNQYYVIDDVKLPTEREIPRERQESPGDCQQIFQYQNKRKLSRTASPSEDTSSSCGAAIRSSTSSSSFSCRNTDTTDVIEALPSSLALYRLICLFEFNCSSYISLDDACVWQVSMLHKKTSGIVHFSDFNGHFRVFVSLPDDNQMMKKTPSTVVNEKKDDNVSSVTTSGVVNERGVDRSRDGGNAPVDEVLFDLHEFREAVIQLLDLLMSESFCHPYGIIAGTVA